MRKQTASWIRFHGMPVQRLLQVNWPDNQPELIRTKRNSGGSDRSAPGRFRVPSPAHLQDAGMVLLHVALLRFAPASCCA